MLNIPSKCFFIHWNNYSQTCLQQSATGNYKSDRCWQVAFVLIFMRRIKIGLCFCGQETTTCRCPYAQVWLYWNLKSCYWTDELRSFHGTHLWNHVFFLNSTSLITLPYQFHWFDQNVNNVCPMNIAVSSTYIIVSVGTWSKWGYSQITKHAQTQVDLR